MLTRLLEDFTDSGTSSARFSEPAEPGHSRSAPRKCAFPRRGRISELPDTNGINFCPSAIGRPEPVVLILMIICMYDNMYLCCVGQDDRVWRPAIQLNRPASVGFRYHDSSSSSSRPRLEMVTACSSAIVRLTR